MEQIFLGSDKSYFQQKGVGKDLQRKFAAAIQPALNLHIESHSVSCAISFEALYCRLRLHHWCSNQRRETQRQRKRKQVFGADAVSKKFLRMNVGN
ncbi:hypothetical protein BOX15_Mlig012766g1 [Macrostomum lignano]|uniref:Uncharacterized protein n=1 Tax=Macrostomum lignano TaxID=282301 RepID=A0A267ENM2_9PLAT|nr:hypothetical protein BOX15_Mlig012766g1 [Macrostomum lignano]